MNISIYSKFLKMIGEVGEKKPCYRSEFQKLKVGSYDTIFQGNIAKLEVEKIDGKKVYHFKDFKGERFRVCHNGKSLVYFSGVNRIPKNIPVNQFFVNA